jgi:nucleoid DNA-binding protein
MWLRHLPITPLQLLVDTAIFEVLRGPLAREDHSTRRLLTYGVPTRTNRTGRNGNNPPNLEKILAKSEKRAKFRFGKAFWIRTSTDGKA